MDSLDADGDKILSVEEVMAEPKTFLKSQGPNSIESFGLSCGLKSA